MTPTPSLVRVNVAKGKPCWQSSWSTHSVGHDAGRAVSGVMPEAFAFHTEVEPNPWWMVDLEESLTIDRIVIHNRIDALVERAEGLHVEISSDGRKWELVYTGGQRFLSGEQALVLNFDLNTKARLIRLSLRTVQYLHLAQVEVFAVAAIDILPRHGLREMALLGDLSTPRAAERNRTNNAYTLEGEDPSAPGSTIAGLRIVPFGRFGNRVFQLINAIALARRIGSRFVKVPSHDQVSLPAPVTAEGLTFLPEDADWPEPGIFFAGTFFFADDLSPVLDDLGAQERQDIIRDIIRPHFLQKLPPVAAAGPEDDLTIHIRSGDIFSGGSEPAGYTQPPLSFYTLLISRLWAEGEINHVTLVFEDRANPCVDALIHFLVQGNIAHRLQSASLAEDLAVLLKARRLVFGYGTFGILVAMLSSAVSTVYCFETLNERDFKEIPSIGSVVVVRDRAGGYTKAGEWQNTIAQRMLMLEYPEKSLEFIA